MCNSLKHIAFKTFIGMLATWLCEWNLKMRKPDLLCPLSVPVIIALNFFCYLPTLQSFAYLYLLAKSFLQITIDIFVVFIYPYCICNCLELRLMTNERQCRWKYSAERCVPAFLKCHCSTNFVRILSLLFDALHFHRFVDISSCINVY